ncbi:DUF4129 domain-containing protein [Nocardioides sp. ChNu-153]|uniref:DUF4129 domain-containing protein n=1 Tax=Nocardioides sp. ChNu-153 TaxID=2779364 RepID=UPI002655C4CF|nr:DUF4129 domain-containing protein [Nocardioides sp. ChNu-153]MDN7120420.1 DUF4129 domain-containing protein [Nocardioides sp. ChNu-153]
MRILADPPLDPAPGEARDALRRELLRPEYNDSDLVQRIVDRLRRWLDDGVSTTAESPPLQTFATLLVAVLLVLALAWLLTRLRGSARVRRAGAVLGERGVGAAELRARAEAALAAGRHEDAVLDAFRALAVRAVERGRIADVPGATAGEVARALVDASPDRAAGVPAAARLFDDVLYGDRPATADQARSVLALDDTLAGAR